MSQTKYKFYYKQIDKLTTSKKILEVLRNVYQDYMKYLISFDEFAHLCACLKTQLEPIKKDELGAELIDILEELFDLNYDLRTYGNVSYNMDLLKVLLNRHPQKKPA